MKLKSAQMLAAGSAAWLSLIFTLYLAPSKYFTADLLAVALLLTALAIYGLRQSGVIECVRPLAPLLAMLTYAAVLYLFGEKEGGAVSHMRDMLIGFVPFLLLYVVFRNQTASQLPILAIAVLCVPGLIHLAFMYWDIFTAIYHDQVLFLTSSRQGFLEYIKDTPRVGRRYLSITLLQLLCAGLLMAWHFSRTSTKYWAWGVASLSVLSLALLDARGGYASVVIGGTLLLLAVGLRRAWQVVKLVLPTGLRGLLLLCLLVSAIGLGYSAGKSRWVSMDDSFSAAAHDVFNSDIPLAQRPFVNESFWSAPIENINKCYLEREFRCSIDQSAYLRAAWLLSGLQSLIKHPFGIGYSDDYMARLWGVAGEPGKYQRNDSFLVELIVSFGLPGILLYALLVYEVLRSLRRSLVTGKASALLVAVCGLLLVCVGRGLVDVLNEGLWRYFMALLGMYYGLLHSYERQVRI